MYSTEESSAGKSFQINRRTSHFLKLLGRLPSRFALRIHGYVLMGNRYHISSSKPDRRI